MRESYAALSQTATSAATSDWLEDVMQRLTGWRMSFWQKRTSKESDQSVIRSHRA